MLEEVRGDVEAAAKEYLAACDIEPDLRESLEAVVRLRWRSPKAADVSTLLQRLADGAPTPAESAQALWQLALFQHTVEADISQAKASLEAAVEADPTLVAAWLELELVAAKDGDTDARMRALEARAGLTNDATWQGLLLIELANACAAAGDIERASNMLDTAAALDGRARFRSRLCLERIAAAAGDAELQAHALEGQAELITLGLEDQDNAVNLGLPSIMCTAQHAADAFLRAGELRRRAGDAWGAVAALSAASERLQHHPLVARLRMAAADAAGDGAAALSIARGQLTLGVEGPAAAAMWVRVGRASELAGDNVTALEAYSKALEGDGASIAALTLQLDMLALGEEAVALAKALEGHAAGLVSDAAKARAWITVAYVWATRAGSVDNAKKAVARAQELGMPAVRVARYARTIAALAGDAAWRVEATKAQRDALTAALASTGATAATGETTPPTAAEVAQERAALSFELGRAHLLAGDRDAAVLAFSGMAEGADDDLPSADAWLGRALSAYAVGIGQRGPRDAGVLQALANAEPDEALRRGLMLVAALIACRGGQFDEAAALLRVQHDNEPEDLAVGLFLADLLRAQNDAKGAAAVFAAMAAAVGDAQLGGALLLEAGFVAWGGRAYDTAISLFEQALDYTPQAGALVLSWALRGAKPDDIAARRRSAELVEDNDGDAAGHALERLGLGFAAADGDADIAAALEELEELNPGGDVALATALGRIVLGGSVLGGSGHSAAAIAQLEPLGGAATAVAAAERFRTARFEERDPDTALAAARGWAEAEGKPFAYLEWLGAAFAVDHRDEEIRARQALAGQLDMASGTALAASAVLVSALDRPSQTQSFMRGDSAIAQLTNLELARPGSDPERRAMALRAAGANLGGDSEEMAARLAAWSDLARGAYSEALEAFQQMVERRPDDISGWEGIRAAAEKLDDHVSRGVALARMGNLCQDDKRAGELWEEAGLVLLEHTDAHDDADIAFARALERDKTRAVAFDKLFRSVRARNDDDRLLKLIAARLAVTEDDAEITKMYWERARVLRRKGDAKGALESLRDVTMLEPDHVGALALSGEISITRGDFAHAAPLLAKLATLSQAPKKQRMVSAIAAVDLYEKRLNEPKKALAVLTQLYRDGLSNAKVRERLARTAARVGNWEAASDILERLMQERTKPEGRAEAARLAMRIYRDKLKRPAGAAKAVRKLLEEIPDDKEAVTLLLKHDVSADLKAVALPRAASLMLASLARDPFDLERVKLVMAVAKLRDDRNLWRALMGVAIALGEDRSHYADDIARLDVRSKHVPAVVLQEDDLRAVSHAQDVGPLADLFRYIAPAVAEAYGPNLKGQDVGRRQRVNTSHASSQAIAPWAGALGVADYQVYVGGPKPHSVTGVAEPMAFVVGTELGKPLDAAGRATASTAAFGLRRGTTAVLYQDDHTIACIATAACNDAGARMAEPPYAMYRAVDKAMKRAMSRRIRRAIADVSQQVRQSGQDALLWARAARMSCDRMALVGAGDAAVVIDQIVGPVGSPKRAAMSENERARALLSFAISDEYLSLRRKLKMGAS